MWSQLYDLHKTMANLKALETAQGVCNWFLWEANSEVECAGREVRFLW